MSHARRGRAASVRFGVRRAGRGKRLRPVLRLDRDAARTGRDAARTSVECVRRDEVVAIQVVSLGEGEHLLLVRECRRHRGRDLRGRPRVGRTTVAVDRRSVVDVLERHERSGGAEASGPGEGVGRGLRTRVGHSVPEDAHRDTRALIDAIHRGPAAWPGHRGVRITANRDVRDDHVAVHQAGRLRECDARLRSRAASERPHAGPDRGKRS